MLSVLSVSAVRFAILNSTIKYAGMKSSIDTTNRYKDCHQKCRKVVIMNIYGIHLFHWSDVNELDNSQLCKYVNVIVV